MRAGGITVIPYFDMRIPAGFPSPANDYLEKPINLNEEFIKHPLSTFIITTDGDSMNGAYIPDSSYLLIDKSLTAKTGDIVLASYCGEFTVKFIELWMGGCRLIPANKKYPAVEITEEMDMRVWGVVTLILIDPEVVKHVRTSRL